MSVPVVADILKSASYHDALNGVTGALTCRRDICMQLMQGPRSAVELTYSRIERDKRHTDINSRFQTLVSIRLFPAWAMRYAPTSRVDVDARGCRRRRRQGGILRGLPQSVRPSCGRA
jgi:hypothetical protein